MKPFLLLWLNKLWLESVLFSEDSDALRMWFVLIVHWIRCMLNSTMFVDLYIVPGPKLSLVS